MSEQTQTKKQTIIWHRKMWDWLAKNPQKAKVDWPRWEENGGDIARADFFCFLCEYTEQNPCCILVWPEFKRRTHSVLCTNDYGQGLFGKWDATTDLVERKRLAERIRDLPINPEVA